MKYRVEIIEYLLDDLHFDYEDGFSVWFDGIKLRIGHPKFFKNREIYIYRDEGLMKENPWKSTGTVVEFEYVDDFNDFEKYDIMTASLRGKSFIKSI
ncbi:MAG: hypothetical protein GF353_04715 [Candidatus Lokiarchaeota archaeon]|nr:hypothetical protein [Candidatus Lokiarchaeota archaeon]